MTITQLKSIISETLNSPIRNVLKSDGSIPKDSSDLLDLFTAAYDGIATLEGGSEIVWSLNRDDDGWSLSYQVVGT